MQTKFLFELLLYVQQGWKVGFCFFIGMCQEVWILVFFFGYMLGYAKIISKALVDRAILYARE